MKMHGCGNDFVVMPGSFEPSLTPERVQKICDRHLGAGADGLILVSSQVTSGLGADYKMIFYNPDGSRAEMCGNGIRCFSKYVNDKVKKSGGKPIKVQVGTDHPRIVETQILANSFEEALVRVNMGNPQFLNPEQLRSSEAAGIRTLNDGRRTYHKGVSQGNKFIYVCMGNPHAVVFTDTPDEDAKKYGASIERDTFLFPKKTNVEFVKVNSPSDLTMRVWERGAGETLACGTGACASLVAANLEGKCGNDATVHLFGGDLQISWAGLESNPVHMTGPARNVCELKDLDRYLFGSK